MDLEKLYNVNSLDEWEDLLDRAIGAGDRTAIIILTDYLRWILKGYKPKSPRATTAGRQQLLFLAPPTNIYL